MVKNKDLPDSVHPPSGHSLSFSLSVADLALSRLVSRVFSRRHQSSWGYPLDPAKAGPRQANMLQTLKRAQKNIVNKQWTYRKWINTMKEKIIKLTPVCLYKPCYNKINQQTKTPSSDSLIDLIFNQIIKNNFYLI